MVRSWFARVLDKRLICSLFFVCNMTIWMLIAFCNLSQHFDRFIIWDFRFRRWFVSCSSNLTLQVASWPSSFLPFLGQIRQCRSLLAIRDPSGQHCALFGRAVHLRFPKKTPSAGTNVSTRRSPLSIHRLPYCSSTGMVLLIFSKFHAFLVP